jgi:hypothetical protein
MTDGQAANRHGGQIYFLAKFVLWIGCRAGVGFTFTEWENR